MDVDPIATMMHVIAELQKKVEILEGVALKNINTDTSSSIDFSTMGESIADEIEKEKLTEIETLKERGIEISHLNKKAKELRKKLKVRGRPGLGAKPITEQELIDIQKIAVSGHDAARKLGVSYQTYKKYAKRYNRHTLIQFPPPKGVVPKCVRPNWTIDTNKGKYPLDDVLQNKWPEFPIHRLKDKLIRSGKKEAACELCGYKERRITDAKIPLLLNFLDGNNKNMVIENLQVLCYNCAFVCGAYIKKNDKRLFDPDILQDSKKILKARF